MLKPDEPRAAGAVVWPLPPLPNGTSPTDATTLPAVGETVNEPSPAVTLLTLAPVVLQVGQLIWPAALTTIGDVALDASVPPIVGQNSAGVPAAAWAETVALPLVDP